jgi:glycerophosphoryl diester phosphodiesterase
MEIVAHRGLWGPAPENSPAAVEAALREGFTFIEIDVRASADGALFVLHDATLDRTTAYGGRLATLSAREAARVRLLDGTPLPRLEEVLELTGGRAVLCIDVKEGRAGPPLLPLLRGRRDGVEVWCHEGAVVRAAADMGVRTALICSGLLRRGVGDLIWSAWERGAAALSFYPADLQPHVAAACRNAGMPFLCGAPNDTPTWRFLVREGARAIITDRALACRRFLTSLSEAPRRRPRPRVASEQTASSMLTPA